jgi:dUTP pyrophosphatase
MYTLYIQPLSDDARALYTKAAADYLAKPYGERDAGLDLYVAADSYICAESSFVGQGLKAALYDPERGIFRAYWMLPRSSISKTPMRLANSVGLIDAGYRGEIKAALYALIPTGGVKDNDGYLNDYVKLEHGTRIVQLAAPDLLPFDDIKIVDEIPGGATLRGAGGFGSTGVGAS